MVTRALRLVRTAVRMGAVGSQEPSAADSAARRRAGVHSFALFVVFVLSTLQSTGAEAFDYARFEGLRNTATRAAAAVSDPVGLRALQSYDGPDLRGGDGPMARAGMDLAL